MAQITYVGDGNTGDGVCVQGTTTGKLGFYGTTPVVQRTSTQLATSLISASSYSTVGSNLAAILTEISNTLLGLGINKSA